MYDFLVYSTEQSCAQISSFGSINFAINTTLAIAGTRVRLSCNTGYVFPDGTVTRTSECLQTVQWDPPVNESCQGIHLALLFI